MGELRGGSDRARKSRRSNDDFGRPIDDEGEWMVAVGLWNNDEHKGVGGAMCGWLEWQRWIYTEQDEQGGERN
ncbi:hypothetical protein V6N13_037391 [Hibiscus sabdariffa]